MAWDEECDEDWEADDSDDDESEDAYDDDSAETEVCPNCRREVYEDAEQCPYCQSYISREDAPPIRKPWWVIITAALCLIVSAWWIFIV